MPVTSGAMPALIISGYSSRNLAASLGLLGGTHLGAQLAVIVYRKLSNGFRDIQGEKEA
jgi:uncharacterized membrane protein YebE (DUF533 family)